MSKHRLSPTTVIACLALFFAVAGGSAIALKGKNTVNSGDIKPKAVKTSDIANNAVTTKKIKNNAVTTKKIKNNAVTTKKIKDNHVRRADIQNNAVGSGEIVNASVATADLAGPEAFHRIGAAGEPAFGNGGQGDCLYSELTAPPPLGEVFNSPGFYKNPWGEVHLVGAFTNADGPGGDAACDGDDLAESILFTLPTGYRPAKLLVVANLQFGSSTDPVSQLIVNGDTDIVAGPTTIPAGAVIATTVGGSAADQTILDGIVYRAAGPGNTGRRGTIEATGAQADLLEEVLGL